MSVKKYVIIGGFLGSGKTTAIIQLACYLEKKGLRAGLITNDQSVNLVDTARAKAAGFPVEEVTGGCFCCRFKSLVKASGRLEKCSAPDILIAEPVGSCTDLKSTVSYPLRQFHSNNYEVAALSVMVDPARCRQMLGLDQPSGFSGKVGYIYRKQLEEAEILVLNKVDTLDSNDRKGLRNALENEFPSVQVLEVSCLTGEGMLDWFDRMLGSFLGYQEPMEVDYDLYAEGEALLGWLNVTLAIGTEHPIDGDQFLLSLTDHLRHAMANRKIEIAHLKTTLTNDHGDMGATSLTSTEATPQLTHRMHRPLLRGVLNINLRAESDPKILESELQTVFKALMPNSARVATIDAFRPGRPVPTHRISRPN